MPPVVVAAAIVASAIVGVSAYSAQSEKTQQKKILAHQEDVVAQAEQKAAGAEVLATQEATKEIKKRRRSQTQTILSSPLGGTSRLNTEKTTLLGG